MPATSIKGQMLACALLIALLLQVFTLLGRVSEHADPTVIHKTDIRTEYAYLTSPVDSAVELETLIHNPDYLISSPFNKIPWQFEPQIYWLRISLTNLNATKQHLHAHFDNLMLEELKVFQVQDKSVLQSTELGWNVDQLPRLQRSIPSFEFDIEGNGETEIFVRIATEGIAKTGVHFFKSDEFTQLVKDSHLIWGVLVGIMLVIALYNLILFFVIRDNLYLIYIGYILSILMMSGVVIGFGHYIWPESFVAFFQKQIIPLNYCATVFTLLFALYFLKYNIDNDKYFKFSLGYTAVMTGAGIVSLFIPEYAAAPVFFALMIGLYGLCITLIIRKAVTDFYWAKFYIISWLPLLIGAAIQPLELTGQIESTFARHYAFSFGVAFEITLMAMALAERMRVHRELALYNATHDLNSSLPNQSLLTNRLQQLLNEHHSGYVCLLKIRRFQTLSAYISSEESNRIANHVQHRVNHHLEKVPGFLVIEKRRGQTTKVAQLTEDTFAVIADTKIGKSSLLANLNTLMDTVYTTLNVSGFSVNLTSLTGIAIYSRRDAHAGSVIKRAFQAVEQALLSQANVRFYRERDSINQSQQLALASDLQNAIRNGELELFHQPQIDLATRKIVGSEVLIRWPHHKRGMVLPEEFIPLAEDMGMINELTLWVLKTACRDLQQLISDGQEAHRVSINVSGKDVCSPHFLASVSEVLQRTSIPPQLLTFELTESVMVDNFQDVNRTMQSLFNLGIHFSIDDYGTGYSSLAYISQMAFTALKIDKSFVQNMDSDAKNFTIVKTTLDMAKALNLRVVAEGIECPRIEQLLMDCNCCFGQGFYYSPPLPFQEYRQWLQAYKQESLCIDSDTA